MALLPERPNILLVVIDTLRWDATGLAGTDNTPFLLELAENGVHFKHNYSTFDQTPASHFSILTGYVNGQGTAIDNPSSSLAWQLDRAGYDTFGIAANGNLTPQAMPILKPFRTYKNMYDVADAMPLQERIRVFAEVEARIADYRGRVNDWNRLAVYVSTERLLPLFRQQLRAARKPFFGFVNITDPHDPYFPDPQHYDWRSEEADLKPVSFDSDIRFRDAPSGPPQQGERTRWEEMLHAAEGRAWSLVARSGRCRTGDLPAPL